MLSIDATGQNTKVATLRCETFNLQETGGVFIWYFIIFNEKMKLVTDEF